MRRGPGEARAYVCSVGLWASLLMGASGSLLAEALPNNAWQVLAVAYPADRTVEVTLGGAEKTLTSRGLCKVKWQKGSAVVEMEVRDLPAASELGWKDRQYVLWAVDRDRRALNLGPVPLRERQAKWRFQVPWRTLGFLVTAEKSAAATAPSSAVVLESLLPTDPFLVVPVFRVQIKLSAAD